MALWMFAGTSFQSLRFSPVFNPSSVWLWESLGKTAHLGTELEKGKRKKRVNEECWGVSQLPFVRGLCWAQLGVIRVLILLHLALHCCDVSNVIQHGQNEINHESDGSSWLFKQRRNGFCQSLLIQHFFFYVCVSFIQNEVLRAMLKPLL